MHSVANNRSFIRQLRNDRLYGLFLLILLLSQLPFFLPGQTKEGLETYGLLVGVLFELPFTVFVLWPRPAAQFPAREAFAWKTLSIAYSGWWVVSMLFLFWPNELWSSSADVLTDGIFLGFYICWMVALHARPDAPTAAQPQQKDRRILTTAMVVLATALFSYFVLIPSRLTPDLYDSWVPSLMFFTGIDFILVLWLINLATKATNHRWRMIYSLLVMAHVLYASLDLLEAIQYAWVYNWARHPASNVFWSLPVIFIAMAARARGFNYPEKPETPAEPTAAAAALSTRISPVIMVSFILPVLHIVLDQFGLIEDVMRKSQAMVILVSLVIFWILAMKENIALRITSHRARKQAEELERLRVKQEVAERTEKIKARFLANVSHEVRTPMNGILGTSEILLRGTLDAEQKEQAELILSSSKEMIKVLDDILDYSKIESGEISLVKEPFRLDGLMESVCKLFASTGLSAHVDLQLDIQNDVPQDLEGDASRLRQVLVNLVSNAVKFSEQGVVNLDISLSELTDSHALVLFKIKDRGIGFDEGAVDDLFLPFKQGDESRSRQYGGSGLGLAISKQIVEAHDGKIGAYGRPGGGAVFWFDIPFLRAEKPVEAAAEPLHAPPSLDSGKKILLAEDDEINIQVALKQLELLGYRADVARNGKEAVEALERNSYDLVLMDCQMPVMDGLQATRSIREKGYSEARLPIIALTANAFDEDRDACLECGMNDFIAKPAQLDTLRTKLSEWL